jgi:hypothetical protein
VKFHAAATALPSQAPTRSEAGPTLVCARGSLALGIVSGMGVALGLWPWWVTPAAMSIPWALLSTGDLIRIGRHVMIGFEPVIRYDLNGDGAIGVPQIRHRGFYIRGAEPPPPLELPDGTETCDPDLAWIIDHLPESGRVPGWGAWKDKTLPSGLVLDDYGKLKPLLDALCNIGAITGRGPKAAGLVVMSRAEMKRRMGL